MEKDAHPRNYEQVDHDRAQMLAQLNGLQRLLTMNISDEAKATVNGQIGRHRTRLALMDTLVQAYDALEADGYPEMAMESSETVQQEVQAILQENREQVKAQTEQLHDELGVVQEIFGGRQRRARPVVEPPKAHEPPEMKEPK